MAKVKGRLVYETPTWEELQEQKDAGILAAPTPTPVPTWEELQIQKDQGMFPEPTPAPTAGIGGAFSEPADISQLPQLAAVPESEIPFNLNMIPLPFVPIVPINLSNVVTAGTGLAKFTALRELESYIISKVTGKEYKFGETKGVSEFLPEDTSQGVKDVVDILEMFGQGALIAKTDPKLMKLWKAATEKITTDANIPKKVYISNEAIRSIYQTGENITPEQMQVYKDLGLSGKQISSLLKSKADIEVDVIANMDKPWFAKMKTLFGIKPKSQIIVKPEGIAVKQTGVEALPGETTQAPLIKGKAAGAQETAVEAPVETTEQPAIQPPIQETSVGKEAVQIMTFEEYAARKGYGTLSYSEVALHKQPGATQKEIKKRANQEWEKSKEWQKQRDKLKEEYNQKIVSGEIRPPTRIEQLIATAKGQEENESVQAARRLLKKQGIDWEVVSETIQPPQPGPQPIQPQGEAQVPTVQGTGELKERGLSVHANKRIIQMQSELDFQDQTLYQQADFKAMGEKVDQVFATNPELGMKIAMGEEKPVEGTLAGMYWTAAENQAILNKDTQTLKKLMNSKINEVATALGQNVAAFRERNPDSPIRIVKEINTMMEEEYKKRQPRISIEQARQKQETRLKEDIKKQIPNKDVWANFIDSITC